MAQRPLFLADYWTLDLLLQTDLPVAAIAQEAKLEAKYRHLPANVELLDRPRALAGLREGKFSRLVVSPRRGAWWDNSRSWISNAWAMRRKYFQDDMRRQYDIPRAAIATGVPLTAINRVDEFHIPEWDHELLAAAEVYYLRERPPQDHHILLNTSRRFRRLSNLDTNPIFAHLKKVRSLSLGVSDDRLPLVPPLPVEKRYDILYSAADASPMRRRARETLRRLQTEGQFRICLPDSFVAREEYFRLAAESYLVVSPAGQGWDCYRHYETALCGTVPVMDYPTIRRGKPLLEGIHGLYYDVDENGLERCLRQALLDRPRLIAMGQAAREHILEHHLYSKLVKTILGPVPPQD